MAADTPTAFVSYSRVDSEFAMQLAEHLKAAGANVWLDQLDIEPGTPWDSAIEEALLRSTHMLVILSTVSVTSDNVRDEVSYALSQQMKVIPVLYRECKVPFRLARLQHIDFRNDYDSAFKALLRTLRVEQQTVPTAVAPAFEDNPIPSEAAERQRRDEEERLQALRAEHLAQQARWEEERQQQLAQRAKWEEEQRLRDQAEAARQAEVTQQAEVARKAELARQAEAARLAEAERQRAAEVAEQKRKQEQDAKAQAAQNNPSSALFASPTTGVKDSPPPQLQSNTSNPSSLGRIVLYAVIAGLARSICLIPMAFLGRLIGYRPANLISAILIGGITGLILYRVSLLFKPELSKKQARTIIWIWLGAGIALAALNMDAFRAPLGPLRILVAILPVAIAGVLTGLTLARALKNSQLKGCLIGIISFAVPPFLSQFSFVFIETRHYSYESFALTYIVLNFCAYVAEVGLLLTFIRNWGQTRSDI